MTAFFLELSLLLASAALMARGDYEVHLVVYSFNNTESKCAFCYDNQNTSLTCCDNRTTDVCTGTDICDLYLSLCKPESSREINSPCPLESRMVSTVRYNARSVSVNQSEETVLGLRKPLIVAFGTLMSWTQVNVELYDRDLNPGEPDDLVDVFVINITTAVGVSTPPAAYQGLYGLASIELSYQVVCTGDCTNSCQPGYTGLRCEITLDPCSYGNISCSGMGECVNGSCVCEPGYTGSNCQNSTEMEECVQVCSGNGLCEQTEIGLVCVCNDGYTGASCDTVLESCVNGGAGNCSGNGDCVADGADGFTCMCADGYTGDQCQTAIQPCLDASCDGGDQNIALNNTTALVAGSTVSIAVLLLIVVILIVVVVVLIKRRNSLRHSNTSQLNKELAVFPTSKAVSSATDSSKSEQSRTSVIEEGYAQIGPVYATLESPEEHEERYREANRLNTKHKYECVDGLHKYEYVDTS